MVFLISDCDYHGHPIQDHPKFKRTTETKNIILASIESNFKSAKEISKELEIPLSTVARNLCELYDMSLVKKEGGYGYTRYVKT